MKTIKYVISFCILFVGMLIIGESHNFRLNNFYTPFINTTLYIQENTTENEMIRDILDSATRNEVEVFAFTKSFSSMQSTDIEIYGTSGVEQYINEQLDIFAQEYPSLFLEDFRFTFKGMESLQNIKDINDYYVIGNSDKAKQFKIGLIDKYAGNHPKEGYNSSELKNNIIMIWALMVFVILLFTYYDAIYQKKESLIRVSLGEPISRIILKNIAIDTFVFSLLFVIIIYILAPYTYVYFEFKLSLICLIVMIALNASLYLSLFFYNLKEAFSNAKGSSIKLLSINYSLKLVTVVITIVVISSNIILISESYQLYKQKPFFEKHKEYSYVKMEYNIKFYSDGTYDDRSKESELVQSAFYKQFFGKTNASMLVTTHGLLYEKGIYTNRNVLNYLTEHIKELQGLKLDKDIYFLMPQTMKGKPEVIEDFKDTVNQFEEEGFQYSYEAIYYEGPIELLRIDEDSVYGSELVSNPLVIFNRMDAGQFEIKPRNTGHPAEVMYNITDEQFNSFIQDNQLIGHISTKTNVFDKFTQSWNIAKRILIMNFIFSMLVLFLEFIIISSIIKLEYDVNAVELSVKKVLGHSIWEKNRKIMLMTLITTVVSIALAAATAILIGVEKVYYLTFGGVAILALELIVIFLFIRRLENAKIQKILRGGSL
ncbi:hypothetical protein ABEW34_04595 [Paenibacillus algorifonticola]|uniref:DUF1430 domain-containing protein n=1 Tax=Paenibacillus algorifonticola TaxID=684063 RepID=UPI003D2C102E